MLSIMYSNGELTEDQVFTLLKMYCSEEYLKQKFPGLVDPGTVDTGVTATGTKKRPGGMPGGKTTQMIFD
jgi:hypothetical protein